MPRRICSLVGKYSSFYSVFFLYIFLLCCWLVRTIGIFQNALFQFQSSLTASSDRLITWFSYSKCHVLWGLTSLCEIQFLRVLLRTKIKARSNYCDYYLKYKKIFMFYTCCNFIEKRTHRCITQWRVWFFPEL